MIAEFTVRTDRWTDRRDKLIVAFRNYANEPKNAFFVVKMSMYSYTCGLGSSVRIATELLAGRPGIESRWARDFPPV